MQPVVSCISPCLENTPDKLGYTTKYPPKESWQQRPLRYVVHFASLQILRIRILWRPRGSICGGPYRLLQYRLWSLRNSGTITVSALLHWRNISWYSITRRNITRGHRGNMLLVLLLMQRALVTIFRHQWFMDFRFRNCRYRNFRFNSWFADRNIQSSRILLLRNL